jgi:hypothetical protein
MRSIRVASFASIIAMAGAMVGIVQAQEKTAPPASGIFVEAAGGQSEVKLPATKFEIKTSGVGKSMATMGMMKPQTQGLFAGAKAYTRLAGDATFRFQFEEKPAGASENMSPQEMMAMFNGGGDGIPSIAKGPQDVALVKLTVADENREAHFGSAGSGHAKDTVDVTVENVGPHTFRVKPKHPLAPGEYAFYVRMQNSPTGQAWDFGVDQK